MAFEILKDGPKIFNSFISLCENILGNECPLANCIAIFFPLEAG